MQVLQEKLRNIRYFALDMDGTIYLGKFLLPGAKEFLEYLRKTGRQYVFLTNNSSQNSESYVEKLAGFGIKAKKDDILTSGEATIAYVKSQMEHARVYLMGTPDLEEEFRQAGVQLVKESPDFVVLGFDKTLTYEKLVNACHFVREKVPLIATHPDINCPVDERTGFIPDVGAMLELIYASTGCKAQKIIGKPHAEMVEALMGKLQCQDRQKIAMVGDRLYTDIQMGINAGIVSVLVWSGETKPEDLSGSAIQPTFCFSHTRHLLEELQAADQAEV